MSNRDAVLKALTEELPLTNKQLGDDLPLDAQQIANALRLAAFITLVRPALEAAG